MAKWNEDLYLPCTLPIVNGKVILKFYDYDTAGSNDYIGMLVFSFDAIKDK